jgi:hypothetical protein
MLNDLRKGGFWLSVVIVVIVLRWAEKSVPAVRAITNPGMNG